ncbi:hypothetical protein EJ02DRAFT_507148 [Clathrospora elynae]|uniref:BTB domain-containing protein n=1 Tax=Clathrospora elynae TaxID=706981 RepID=A0A6A5S792_9PLEO|nr:hypothetical protein EJ02DRAFT_507148 [Clathrospora elynae]
MSLNETKQTNTADDVNTKDRAGITISPVATPSYPKVLTLNVGGREFKTSLDTLCAESGFFAAQFSDRWTWAPETDGSYFLDADPNLFEHLLRFMRRPGVFPLFYDNATGHDYDLYNQLEAEADYFQMDALYGWIKEKTYLQAVKVQTDWPVTRELDNMTSETVSVTESKEFRIIPRIRKVYICPRGISVHMGAPEKCGMACAKAQGNADVGYDEVPYLNVVTIKKEIVFDEKVCRVT